MELEHVRGRGLEGGPRDELDDPDLWAFDNSHPFVSRVGSPLLMGAPFGLDGMALTAPCAPGARPSVGGDPRICGTRRYRPPHVRKATFNGPQ